MKSRIRKNKIRKQSRKSKRKSRNKKGGAHISENSSNEINGTLTYTDTNNNVWSGKFLYEKTHSQLTFMIHPTDLVEAFESLKFKIIGGSSYMNFTSIEDHDNLLLNLINGNQLEGEDENIKIINSIKWNIEETHPVPNEDSKSQSLNNPSNVKKKLNGDVTITIDSIDYKFEFECNNFNLKIYINNQSQIQAIARIRKAFISLGFNVEYHRKVGTDEKNIIFISNQSDQFGKNKLQKYTFNELYQMIASNRQLPENPDPAVNPAVKLINTFQWK